MKTIIVATDFSHTAADAANYAADMAMAVKAGILLFYTCQVPVSFSEVLVAASVSDPVKDGEISLAKLKVQLLARTNHAIDINILVKEGAFFNELESICAQVK